MASRTEKEIDNGEHLIVEGGLDVLHRGEVLNPASVEITFGDPMTDAARLRELYI